MLSNGSDMPLSVPMDVYDVFGTKIVDAGRELSAQTLEEITASDKYATSCRLSLKGSRVLKDMESVLRGGSISRLFLPGRIDEVLAMYNELRMLPVLFMELEFMRERSMYVYQHTLRTAALTASLAMDLFGKDRASLIGYSALSHDFGMVRLPDEVLRGYIGINPEKRQLLYSHTAVGYVVLSYYLGTTHFDHCRVALEHHERRNGTGYPKGIDLNDSLIEILAVTDALDALLCERPFRSEPFELRAALDLLWTQAKAGILNAEAVKLLISYSRRTPYDPGTFSVAEKQRDDTYPESEYINWQAYQQQEDRPGVQG